MHWYDVQSVVQRFSNGCLNIDNKEQKEFADVH